jgi:hypothetical protein
VNENELNERADILLKRAREIFDGGDDKGAYELYRESLKLVVPNMAKPAWLTQAEDGLSRSKAALEGRLSSGLDKAERALGTNEAGELKQAAVTARSALSECPEFGRAKKLLDDVYGRLDELGMEHIMRAETLRRFSGCKEAAGEYRLAMSVSAFSEVPAYQKAELALSQCK